MAVSLTAIEKLWPTADAEGRNELLEIAHGVRYRALGSVVILGIAPFVVALKMAHNGNYHAALWVFGFGFCALMVYWPAYRRWTAWVRWAEKERGE